MVDTVHVTRSMERNLAMENDDFYLARLRDGRRVFAGSLTLDEAGDMIEEMKLERDCLVTASWVPVTPPPALTCSLKRVFARPDLLKTTATAYMKWLLGKSKMKRGEKGFLGWQYPAERAR